MRKGSSPLRTVMEIKSKIKDFELKIGATEASTPESQFKIRGYFASIDALKWVLKVKKFK